jgi:putative CocE/NonD family hydrolase
MDTDFAVVLSEVDDKGQSINITHGVVRMRYRDGLDRPAMMQPGEIYRAAVDLWHVSIEIPAGSRLRVAISSSYFPVYDRNLNTGGDNFTDTDWTVATNRIHHDAANLSAIHLPVQASA